MASLGVDCRRRKGCHVEVSRRDASTRKLRKSSAAGHDGARLGSAAMRERVRRYRVGVGNARRVRRLSRCHRRCTKSLNPLTPGLVRKSRLAERHGSAADCEIAQSGHRRTRSLGSAESAKASGSRGDSSRLTFAPLHSQICLRSGPGGSAEAAARSRRHRTLDTYALAARAGPKAAYLRRQRGGVTVLMQLDYSVRDAVVLHLDHTAT